MEIPLYLAMTAGEFSAGTPLPPNIAWMACHFSSSGEGLSNIPSRLPARSLLILDDSIPIANHRAEIVAEQLSRAVETLKPDGILLDFQRPEIARTEALVTEILSAIPCPVGVSHHYAKKLSCPIFLPPLPAHQTPEDYLSPYAGREVWLEVAPVWETVTVTESGSRYCPADPLPPGPHRDEALYCHYGARVLEDKIIFSLCRTREDIEKMLGCKNPGLTRAIGLYQELG